VGKGTITGGGALGRFTVFLDYGSDIVAQRIALLGGRITETQGKITTEQAILDSLRITASIFSSAVDTAINAYIGSENGDDEREAVDKATLALLEKLKEVRLQEVKIEILKLELANLQVDLAYVESLSVTDTRSLWCADHTLDADGASATIEIDGEPPQLLLAPGCPAPSPADGALLERGAMSAEQVFLNSALLPGWQRWMPTYRVGVISEINSQADTCTVNLDAATSSAQSLDINRQDILENVPVEYMECNAGIFEDGDRVVVKFEGKSWDTPKVIGFESNPKPCAPSEIAFAIEALNGSTRVVSGGPTYTAMYSGIAGTPTNVGGLNRYTSTPHDLPSPGWAQYDVIADTVRGGSYDQNDGVLRFDLAMQKIGDSTTFGTGSHGGTIIRSFDPEDYGTSLTLTGVGQGQIDSPHNSPLISYFTDNRTTTTVQNGDGEDITFGIGTTINGVYSAFANIDNVDVFQDSGIFDGIFRNYYTVPASVVLTFSGRRFRYDLKYSGPSIAVQNNDTLFSYVPTGDVDSTSTAYKRWLWATYELGAALPDLP